ncbi:MAG: hypothetical protein LBR84_07095 [Tannerella sp.]|jgi:hypothetical protein|nr:hypothetical protein [Tannerella sp.]
MLKKFFVCHSNVRFLSCGIATGTGILAATSCSEKEPEKQPNILVIVAEAGFDHSYMTTYGASHFYPVDLEDDIQVSITDTASYYQATAITDKALEYLKEHASQHSDNPFFLYRHF